MIPFPFFIPREPVYKTILPTVSDSRVSGIAHMPRKTSQHVIESSLYFGLDLGGLSSHKSARKS